MGLVGLVSPCRRAFVSPKIFLVGISWVQNIFLRVFRGFQIFSHGYFLGPKFYDFQLLKNEKKLMIEEF